MTETRRYLITYKEHSLVCTCKAHQTEPDPIPYWNQFTIFVRFANKEVNRFRSKMLAMMRE